MPSWWPRRCWEAHPEVQEGSRRPPRGPERVGRPTCRFWLVRDAHKEIWGGWEAHLKVLVGSRGPPRGLGGGQEAHL